MPRRPRLGLSRDSTMWDPWATAPVGGLYYSLGSTYSSNQNQLDVLVGISWRVKETSALAIDLMDGWFSQERFYGFCDKSEKITPSGGVNLNIDSAIVGFRFSAE